jgi:hypothetical protein
MDEEFVDPNEHYANREITTPENHSGDDDESATLYRVVGWLALSAVILTVGYSYADMDWLFGSNDQTAQIESSIPKAQPARLSDKPTGTEIVADKVQEITGLSLPESIDWRKQEEIAANRSAVEDFRTKLESISSLGTANAEQLIALQAKTQELLTSEAGAKIGSDSKYVEQYIALQEKIEKLMVSIPVADRFAGDMLALLDRVGAANDTSYAPQEFVTTRANDYQKQLQEKTDELKQYDVAIDRLVATTGDLVGELPLESAVNSLLERKTSDLAETLANARKETEEIKNAELVRAEQNKIAAKADLEIEKKKTETAGLIAQQNEVVLSAARRRLEQEFNRDRNAINSYLIPFISTGSNMRGNAAGKGPASFSAIHRLGALENTADGLASLSKAAKNGRPLGGFPSINIAGLMLSNNSTPGSYYNTPKYRGIEAYLEKAQSLLNKYGRLMVEKGLLAK